MSASASCWIREQREHRAFDFLVLDRQSERARARARSRIHAFVDRDRAPGRQRLQRGA
jgi:hypothetical protein